MSDPIVKEVRLGLVCYGGVSLAIYMHGLTKELFKLVRAARAFDRATQDGDYDPDTYFGPGSTGAGSRGYDSEPAYFAALKALADSGTPLTVAVDVIAGTSAGGINGVCLARALAGGRSLDGFRELWLDDADMVNLLAGHALFPWGRGKLLTKLAESVARLGRHPEQAVLSGDLMCRLLYQALSGMEQVEEPLIGPEGSLDLFVTTTNVHGYDTVIPTGAGGFSHTDTSYRQLMHFAYQQEPLPAAARFETDFGDVPALAFAARATASFPGAFPPVSLSSFFNAVYPGSGPGQGAAQPKRPDSGVTDKSIARHFVYGPGYGRAVEDQWFMDGGILDNGPFDHVIDAIATKRADGPIAREIIYLEPDPGAPVKPQPPAALPDANEPSFAGTIWASRVTIPWHTSMAGVLGELESMNATIDEVGAIVQALQPAVLQHLATAVPVAAAALSGTVAYDDVTQNQDEVRVAAQQLAGNLGYDTYCRLRVQAVAESFGMTIAAELGFPSESNRSSFVVAVLTAWARQQGSWAAGNTATLEAQLNPVDVPFRLRRAEFILQGINDLFSRPGGELQPDLSAMKSKCWDLLDELRAKQQSVASIVRAQALTLFGPQALRTDAAVTDPDAFARARGPELALLYDACLQAVTHTGVTGTSQDLWTTLADRSSSWEPGGRSLLLARYVGFPVWDSLIFPVVSLAKLPQLTPITVQRFSPLDATCLHAVNGDGTARADPTAKLDGVTYSHFGAFFERAWRENDYLWGRLDGAELVLRLLSRQSGSDLDLTECLRSGFTSILDAEQANLGQIGQAWSALKAQVAKLTAGSMTQPG